ncbi:hypothetical protein [Streptomyces mirabilis]|uniref:Uncharacterized protein n=1 Tax=Streptomyces mirabilis TaxID=68239 RepID=A0A1I2HV99_9ACTN|nr:hypothetical protein [Streptomyces mirabilis]SFF33879.1 hypothetical protein SAMN02787118_105453 [Streptomyces mirabilis]
MARSPDRPPGGHVSARLSLFKQTVPQTYNPDPTACFGDRKCLVVHHDYDPTPGCGGFKLDVVLHNVRKQPGCPAGLTGVGGGFAAYTDTARAFGCLRPDGTFDQGPKFSMNFPSVQVSCPEGMTPTQFGLKVSDITIGIDDPNVFGTTTWSTPGPFYE